MQWSIVAGWDQSGALAPDGSPRQGIVEFRWVDGAGGYQIDFTPDGVTEVGRYHVEFEGTETFDGFVKWTVRCVQDADMQYRCMKPGIGCPKCGTILNAQAAKCDGEWHEDNKTSLRKLEDYLWTNFPRAVKQTDGDPVLAAMQLIEMARGVVTAYWPIVSAQVAALIQHLESAGIDLKARR